jgi:tRNA U54 and U55 pseudouridine synthase Pus10
MTSTTTALLQNLATLRATRDAIMAEIDALNTAPAEVEPCGVCGNDFEAYNCECEAPTFEHFDY